jgi:uncharacterized protein GlcG (DUF336 family)
LSLTGVLLFAGQCVHAEAPELSFLRLATANAMAESCFAQAHLKRWPPFSIAIVDSAGYLIVFRRQDGASSVSEGAAILKARTAARSGIATGDLAAVSQDAPTRDLFILLQLTNAPGGMPFKQAGHIVAGIGVSGGTPEQDVGCASLALNATSGV